MNPDELDRMILGEMEEFAFNIALNAGQILLDNFGKPLDLEFKDEDNTNPVTNLDRKSEDYLRKQISEKYPEHAILSEESGISGQTDSSYIWVLDPLDGTSNYLNRFPFFAVSVGVLRKGKPVVGAIYVPVGHLGEAAVYHAYYGNGAYCNQEQITVSAESSKRPLVELPVFGGSGQFKLSGKSGKEPYEARNLGSIAQELTLAASGIFEFTFFSVPKIWDVAAGALLVQEAGGLVCSRVQQEKTWQSLDFFQKDENSEPDIEQDLKKWSASLVAGRPDTVKQVVQDIKVSRSAASRLKRILLSGHVKKEREKADAAKSE